MQQNVEQPEQLTKLQLSQMIVNARGNDRTNLFLQIGEVDSLLSQFSLPSIPPSRDINIIRIKLSELKQLKSSSIFADYFPFVENVDVLMADVEAKDALGKFLIPLIKEWKGTLRSLQIWATFSSAEPKDEPKKNSFCRKLMKSLDHSPRLSKLTIDMEGYFCSLDQHKSPSEMIIDLPVLSRLVTFNISTHDDGNILACSFAKFDHARLERVRIANPLDQDALKTLMSVKNDSIEMPLKMMVTTKSGDENFMFVELPTLREFCRNFKSVTHLRIRFSDSLTPREWFPLVSSLSSLRNLFIEGVTEKTFNCDDCRPLSWWSPRLRMINLSVLSLQLMELKSHKHLISPLWRNFFPALHEIHVHYDLLNCEDCHYDQPEANIEPRSKKECMRQVSRPLLVCNFSIRVYTKEISTNSFEFFDGGVEPSNADVWKRAPPKRKLTID